MKDVKTRGSIPVSPALKADALPLGHRGGGQHMKTNTILVVVSHGEQPDTWLHSFSSSVRDEKTSQVQLQGKISNSPFLLEFFLLSFLVYFVGEQTAS